MCIVLFWSTHVLQGQIIDHKCVCSVLSAGCFLSLSGHHKGQPTSTLQAPLFVVSCSQIPTESHDWEWNLRGMRRSFSVAGDRWSNDGRKLYSVKANRKRTSVASGKSYYSCTSVHLFRAIFVPLTAKQERRQLQQLNGTRKSKANCQWLCLYT